MQFDVRIGSFGTSSISLIAGLLLYWNASLFLSRGLTAFLATIIAMKLDLLFHLVYASVHHLVAAVLRVRHVWDAQEALTQLETHSPYYVILDVGSIALLVGNTLQYWTAALITRLALGALATRLDAQMRWWESQSRGEHALTVLGCLACVAGCALQWAYYTLLPREEMEEKGFATLLMWYTSLVYIVGVGLRATCVLTTAMLRLGGYRVVQYVADKAGYRDARTLEDSALNPRAEVHALYMDYVYVLLCAATAWYYSPSLLPAWMQGFVLLRLYLVASSSGKLQRYQQVLNRFPSVVADPSKSCVICHDDFTAGEQVPSLPCGHTFHPACLRSWLMRSTTCPICRHSVDDAALASLGRSRRAVRREGRVGAAGGRYVGSVQPLAPRLPAAGPWPHGTATSAQSSPRVTAVLSPLPHVAELQRVDAARIAIARSRQQLLTPVSAAVGQGNGTPARHVAQRAVPAPEAAREASMDADLFTDAPLTHVDDTARDTAAHTAAPRTAPPPPPPPRQKRQRPPSSTAASADGNDNRRNDDEDQGAPRPRRE